MLRRWTDVLPKLIAYLTFKLFRTRAMIEVWVAGHKSLVCCKRGQVRKGDLARSGSGVLEFPLYDGDHVFLHIALLGGARIQFNKLFVLFFGELGGGERRSGLGESFIDVVPVLRLWCRIAVRILVVGREDTIIDEGLLECSVIW